MILPAFLETIVAHLVPLFLSSANNDPAAARQAAAQMLTAYVPETEPELSLAANIISLNLHALQALGQAANPDLPLNEILRLRSGAVSLSREAEKAERRLDQLRAARRDAAQPQPETAVATAAAREKPTPAPHPTPIHQPPVGSKAYQQQQAARRIADTFKRNQAAYQATSTA
jgi:hypothetical protein